MNTSNPPEGTWLRREGESLILGAVLRVAIISNWIIAILFSTFLIPIIQGIIEMDLLNIIFGIPFAFPSLWLFSNAIMSTFGHVEIRFEHNQATIFSGVGRFGRKRQFNCSEFYSIEPYLFVTQMGNDLLAIKIEADRTIKFGGYMKEEARGYIIKMIQNCIEEGDKIRNSLDPNLSKHLID